MIMKKKQIQQKTTRQEIEYLCNKHDGLLKPIDILTFAKNKKTALHKCFEWSDTKAAHEYRLWQAREILRVHVKILPGHNKAVRAFISLVSDRQNVGGGYRTIENVMLNKNYREELLEQALDEFGRFEEKYKSLKELAGVFAEIRKIKKKAKVA